MSKLYRNHLNVSSKSLAETQIHAILTYKNYDTTLKRDLGRHTVSKTEGAIKLRDGRRRSIAPHTPIVDHIAYISIDLAETIRLLSRSRLIFPALASIES